jgi:hypothetical protein
VCVYMKHISVYVHVYKHSFHCFLWQCLVFRYTCPTTSQVILESCPAGDVVTWVMRSRHMREEVWMFFPPPRTTNVFSSTPHHRTTLPLTRSHAGTLSSVSWSFVKWRSVKLPIHPSPWRGSVA